MQQQITDTERDAIFQKLKENPENNKCFDCDKKNPKWASVYLGLYICLDCAGKHREYGPQISFARSLNLDTWNLRYITFMEQGGNTKALEYFKKQGLKAPFDYKSAVIQKYKQELTKKADAVLNSSAAKEGTNKPIYSTKVEEEKPQSQIKTNSDTMGHALSIKSFSDKPKHGEKASDDDPFANNIIINKADTKTKGFTVEFSKNKPAFGTSKGRIAAKKIDNVDLDALSLNEDGSDLTQKKFEMAESSFGVSTQQGNVKEVFAKNNSATLKEQEEDKFKKFSNAKAISSDAFRTDNKAFDSTQMKKFSGASAISSAQYFGNKEEEPEGVDYYQAAENVKDFFSTVGGKLKEKAEGVMTKIRDDWST